MVVSSQLQQMCADGIEAVVADHPVVGVKGGEQARLRSSHHRDGDGAVERHHRVGRDTLEKLGAEPDDSEAG